MPDGRIIRSTGQAMHTPNHTRRASTRAKSSFYSKSVAMSSVLLVKTAGEVAPQVLCDEGPRLADSASRTLASPVLRLVLLLSVRQLFLEEIYNHSTLGAPLHIRFHLRRLSQVIGQIYGTAVLSHEVPNAL